MTTAEDLFKLLVARHLLEQAARQHSTGPEIFVRKPVHGDGILALNGKVDFEFTTTKIPTQHASKYKVQFVVDDKVVGQIDNYQTGTFTWDPKAIQPRSFWVHTVNLVLLDERGQRVDNHTLQFMVVLPQPNKPDTIDAVVKGSMLLYRQAGDRGARGALRLLQAGLRHLDNNSSEILYMAACTCSILGEHDAAIGFLQRVGRKGGADSLRLLIGIMADPDFEKLKKERPVAVRQLMQEFGFAGDTTPLIPKKKKRRCCCF